jgi:hypothetical protein
MARLKEKYYVFEKLNCFAPGLFVPLSSNRRGAADSLPTVMSG